MEVHVYRSAHDIKVPQERLESWLSALVAAVFI